MPKYTARHPVVEARQHEGPKIVVNSEVKGSQAAVAGDYLVTDATAQQPRGSIFVVSKTDFERDYEPVDEAAATAAQATTDNLLAAARNALRSYQFGNASPDLAKEIADAIMAHLNGEDAPPEVPAKAPKAAK
jgi:hypothetical protein